jgi:hypothetical protein
MRSVSPKILREILAYLYDQDLASNRWVPALERALGSSRANVGNRKRRETKKAARRQKVATLRERVWERSKGRCENCGLNLGHALSFGGQMDHMLGGSGRRMTAESIYSCWRICAPCHRDRTDNAPSSAFWFDRMQAHLDRAAEQLEATGGDAAGYYEVQTLLSPGKTAL